MGHYNFTSDLERAIITENMVGKLLSAKLSHPVVKYERPSVENWSHYDLKFSFQDGEEETLFEVKEDFFCADSGNVAVEYEAKGDFRVIRKSGISLTKSDYYIEVVHHHGNPPEDPKGVYLIPTTTLKKLITDKVYHRIEWCGDGKRAHNYLFESTVLLPLMIRIDTLPDNSLNLEDARERFKEQCEV